MKSITKYLSLAGVAGLASLLLIDPAMAQDGTIVNASTVEHQKFGAALGIAIAVCGGAMAQGKAVSSMLEAYGRNPAVGGKLLTPLLLGLALIESLVIFAFVICFSLA